MPRRIVINTKFGGFSLSSEAQAMYLKLTKGTDRPPNWFLDEDIARDDPMLLQVVDTLGLSACSGTFSHLGIAEIPDDIPSDGWIIQEYDGSEWVAETHRTWHAVENSQEKPVPHETPKNKPDSPCPLAARLRTFRRHKAHTRPSWSRLKPSSIAPRRTRCSPRRLPGVRSRMSRHCTPGTVASFGRSENRVN